MAHIPKLPLPAMVEPIDVDATQDNELDRINKRIQMHLHGHHSPCHSPRKSTCEGILIKFPDGKDGHTSYPFGLHKEHTMPWDYHSIDDSFYIQAKTCQKWTYVVGKACEECQKLTLSTVYTGIFHRIINGTHENAPLAYHGIGGLMTIVWWKSDLVTQLHLSKLNDSRRLLAKASMLEDHKQLILVIASGRVERVTPLIQATLKNGVGIGTIIHQYEQAAEKLYHPKGYSNEDIMWSIILLQLGGAHVAKFAHRSLVLPSLTTIWHNTVLPTLVVSPSAPSLADVETNIVSCYSAFDTEGPLSSTIIHQVLMLDEIAIEKHVRWNDSVNKFQGIC